MCTATLLRDHITLTCRSIDRLFLQAYLPKLHTVGPVCTFLHSQRGFRIPSSAAFGQIGEAYLAAIHQWAEANGVPIRSFAKGENKEKIDEDCAALPPCRHQRCPARASQRCPALPVGLPRFPAGVQSWSPSHVPQRSSH